MSYDGSQVNLARGETLEQRANACIEKFDLDKSNLIEFDEFWEW